MKKIQSILCITLLSTTLVGNAFASGTISPPVFSVLNNVVNAVAWLFGSDSCPPRQCQNCRPSERDENDNCRPRDN